MGKSRNCSAIGFDCSKEKPPCSVKNVFAKHSMQLKKILKREFEVTFSKDSQLVWFRIMKYIVLGQLMYFFCDTLFLWIFLGVFFILGLALHLWYRHKTDGWTKSYGLWKYDNK